MNILIITSNLPYPLNSGGNQAQFNAIDYFIKQDVNISVIFNQNKINNLSYLGELKKKWCNVSFYPYDWRKSRSNRESLFKRASTKLFNKFFATTKQFNYTDLCPTVEITPEFIELINDVIIKHNINIVQIDFRYFLPLIYAIPSAVKTVFIQHEIQFVRNKLVLDNLNFRSLYQNYVYNKMRSDEINAMNNFDLVISLTENDKEILVNNGVATVIESSPASISNITLSNQFIGASNQLVFIGGSSHFPNKQGLMWFLEEVWSYVLFENKDVRLNVIGKWNAKEISELQSNYPNICFLGFVEDLSPYLSYSLMIVPIRIGSGMRMKIVDAANYGCPFISTSVGVEGLNFINDKDCFITDDNLEFAKKILQLLNSPSLQKQFSQNVKKVFNTNYSFEILGKRRFDLLKQLIN